MTEQNLTIQQVLSTIQKALEVPKTRHNKFGGYNYRSCEDILDAVKRVMPDGAFVRLSDEPVMIGERYYIKAQASFEWQGEGVVSYGYAREEESKKGMDASQVTGGASSYARKYALNGLFSVDDSVDADATNTHDKEEKPKKPAATDEQKKAAAKAWVADFAEKMTLADEAAFVDLMATTGEHRKRIAASYPDLVVSIEKAVQQAEDRIKGVLDDSIAY
jgi:hypothetical protein